ncbi:MAG: hypothetical protein IPL36_03790 [Nigerium sp.]|nr:hypothetical protein [Nigerium sp.]
MAALLLTPARGQELLSSVDAGPGDVGGVRVLMAGWTLPDASYAAAACW